MTDISVPKSACAHFSATADLTRRDRDDPDADVRKVSGDRQGHADDAAFAGRVRRLTTLAFEGSHACRVDNDPALTERRRVILRHHLGHETDHVEGATGVYLHANVQSGSSYPRSDMPT